jgi:hypothetical protein
VPSSVQGARAHARILLAWCHIIYFPDLSTLCHPAVMFFSSSKLVHFTGVVLLRVFR